MEKMINEGRNNDIAMMRDMYKDVYGSRPGVDQMNAWKAMTDEEFGLEIDYLDRMVGEEIEREKAQQNAAAERFEKMVAEMMADHNINRETAIRWIADAEEVDGDMEYLCYRMGLRYHYFDARA